MKQSRILLALATCVLAVSAQAGGIQARDVPRISNGGTGVIGGVEPDAYPYQARQAQGKSASAAMSSSTQMSMQPGRAMPQAQAQATRDTSVMGSGAAQSWGGLAPRHPGWGTPD